MNRFVLLLAATTVFGHRGLAAQHQSRDHHGLRPIVSRDGQWIAFGSDRDGVPDIYVTKLGETTVVRLTADSFPEGSIAWSGDGKQVLYSVMVGDTARLYSVQLDGTGRTEILRVPGRNPMISPDGRKVVYATGGWQDMQVVTADRDGSHAQRISPAGAAYYNHRFSPDGSQVAVSRSAPSSMQVWLLSLDGKTARPLTHFTEGRPQAPAWSPDGRTIAVQAAVADPQDPRKYTGNVWIVDVQSGQATKLAEHAASYLDETPSWFPDGRRIAFQSNRTGRWEVWVMNADGTDGRQITR